MSYDKPPAYNDNMAQSGPPYQQLTNEAAIQNPYPQSPFPMANPYGNFPQGPSQIIIAQPPAPVMQPSTTVNVNTGPIQKRYCCSCCCTCFWIIVIIFFIAGLANMMH